ncbi:RNA polymerase sigma factor SigB [Bacillus sp. CLL-7-23]|uniref:RNA polymerase sigma factor SigB n=1 Tax=Bacillus changyiensis TaxID=3004103 RepID=A0ABT4X2R1_9BACI|nr:RNA polymerase sigma factor SigB [Bacillus changyiensis]MDA7026561.1 RNA polymerase sigma factor SigB [Bacillus changyiensis]
MTQPSKNIKLTKDDIARLIKEYQNHQDENAQLTLVQYYTNLVEKLANKYSRGKNFHEDLQQVGMLGLLGALKRYDPEMGKSFEAFAIPTIIGEIKRFLRDKTWSVHVPRRIKELGPKIKSAVDQLTTKTQRSPRVDEIAEFLNVTEEDVLETMEMVKSYHALSVDHSIEADTDGSTVTILDMVGTQEEGYEKVNQKLMLDSVLDVLSDREKQILDLTYIQNKSQKEAGQLLGISQMHVSRLQRKAVKRLREALAEDPFMELKL